MTLAIGDLQGCDDALQRLLAHLPPGEGPLWFCGDLVNRGPDSLGALRRVRAMGPDAVSVLGNHDLHLLAVASGARRPQRADTLEAILAATDRDACIDWLRTRPLAHRQGEVLLVHAGLWPQWDADDAMHCAAEVERVLRSPDWGDFLRTMYGDRPDRWDDALSGDDRLRAIVNAFTRMRYLSPDGRMDFATKEGPGAHPEGLLPWFEAPGRRSAPTTVVFGHWSTLGLLVRPNLIGLDTGCVWGGALTAIRLEDRRTFSVDCPQARAPGAN
jgi:bis(5'-nucleosyl)-tetraphosphatase (symmetrical)